MFKLVNKRLRSKKGFTLIELVVVIAILGILAAIAIPRFVGTQDRANQRAHDTNVSILSSGAQLYLAEFGSPADDEDWDGTAGQNWEDYLDSWPENPTDSGDYSVTIGADGSVDVSPAAGDYD